MKLSKQVLKLSEDVDTYAFADKLLQKYGPEGLKTLALYQPRHGGFELNSIEVDQSKRGNGVGTKVMNDIIKFADDNKLIVVLSPSEIKTSKLIKWYKTFDFLDNSGRNKDFRFARRMIRYPLGLTRSKWIDKFPQDEAVYINESAFGELESEFNKLAETEDYSSQLKFLKKAYDVFKKEKFNDELGPCSIEFKKKMPIEQTKSVGLWYEKTKTLRMDQRLFYAGWNGFKEVLLHEMSHQATPLDGHGKLWKAKVISVGGIPKTSTSFSIKTCLSPSEKALIKKINDAKASAENFTSDPKVGTPVKMLDKNGWVLGILCGWVMSKPVMMVDNNESKNSYKWVGFENMYKPTKEEIAEIKKMKLVISDKTRSMVKETR